MASATRSKPFNRAKIEAVVANAQAFLAVQREFELLSARATSLAAIASREGVTDRYVARLIRLAFPAPKIVETITERGELADLKLTPHVDLPFDWATQKRVVGLE